MNLVEEVDLRNKRKRMVREICREPGDSGGLEAKDIEL